MALLEYMPGKRVDYGVDTGGLLVSICNPTRCSALNFFNRFYIVCRVCVPDSGRVLHDLADKGFICCFYGFLFPIFRFLLRKPSVLFTLLVMVSMCTESTIPVVLSISVDGSSWTTKW